LLQYTLKLKLLGMIRDITFCDKYQLPLPVGSFRPINAAHSTYRLHTQRISRGK